MQHQFYILLAVVLQIHALKKIYHKDLPVIIQTSVHRNFRIRLNTQILCLC